MNLRRCENGHFYDADKFENCPHCQTAGKDNDVTMPFNQAGGGFVTQPFNNPAFDQPEAPQMEPQENYGWNAPKNPVVNEPVRPEKEALSRAVTVARTGAAVDEGEEKTVSYYNTKIGKEPVVGWLVCIEGAEFGESFRLKTGRNFIGRGSNMDICLKGDTSVSRDRHAIVLYEPKRREFIAQAGESRELFYVNDDVVLNPQKLARYDILSIGETQLMFFPCCDEHFSWDDYKKDK